MHVKDVKRTITAGMLLLGLALTGCSHNADTQGAPPVQPGSNQVGKALPSGPPPPPTSPALEQAKQRFGHQ